MKTANLVFKTLRSKLACIHALKLTVLKMANREGVTSFFTVDGAFYIGRWLVIFLVGLAHPAKS